MQRSAGILLPVSSLPSPYGIGCFSQEAYDFVDWLKDAGQTYWQILPLGVTSYGDSPYQSFSAFAGNPYFISLDELVKEGVLTAEECKKAKFGRKADDIDYSQLYKERGRLLRLAYSRSDIGHNAEFAAFCEQNKWWLDDFALFMAVKDRFEGKPWIEWAEDIRLRWQNAMDYYRRELYFEVEYYKYLQFKFDQQWRALKAYANEKGIRIIGDIPIYVALDSADAWANPQMFQLDEDNIPTAVAGVPPDGFSPTGQLWGNPLYRWEKHRETGYQWWITRLWYCFELYDVVRIDHFRGFDEYFSIPYGSETAAPGHWEKGPGIELFRAVEQALGKREIIAEDLGYMSETVRQLVRDSGFPGMKVLEFAFDSRDTGSASDYLPHNYPVNSVAYTGTHDNETLVSWYQTITSAERALVRDYLCDYVTPEAQLYKSMIALIFRSAAATCIIPMQDWLGLDNSARINKPLHRRRELALAAKKEPADPKAAKRNLQYHHPLWPHELGITRSSVKSETSKTKVPVNAKVHRDFCFVLKSAARAGALQFFDALRLIGFSTALHQVGVQPAAVAVTRNTLPPPYQTEPAFSMQGAAGRVVLQHGGLQGPVALFFGIGAQSVQELGAQSLPTEALAHINAHLGHAPVAPAGIYPVQGSPPGQHAVGQNDQPTLFGVGGVPRSIGRTVGLEGGVLGGNAFQIDPGHIVPVLRHHGPDRYFTHVPIPNGSRNAP